MIEWGRGEFIRPYPSAPLNPKTLTALRKMDLIQATRRRLFTVHQVRATFVRSSAATAIRQQNTPIIRAIGKERSSNLAVLIIIVTGVGLMHAFGFQCFFWQGPLQELSTKPLIMEVATITIPAPKPEVTPKQTPAPLPIEAKRPHKKIQHKPKLKKQPLSAQGMAFSPEEQELLQQLLQDFDMRQFTINKPDQAVEAQAQPYTEVYLDAAYDHNPKPEYPSIARSRGWQGKVILRVQINEEGKVQTVEIEKSSTHELLDESALETVKHWRFVPAMRGNKAVASSVLVPIIFTLQSQDSA